MVDFDWGRTFSDSFFPHMNILGAFAFRHVCKNLAGKYSTPDSIHNAFIPSITYHVPVSAHNGKTEFHH